MPEHILYSFRRCPYAIRARWAIRVCNLEVELREIDLKDKPKELLNISQNKTVPLLVLSDGRILQESLAIVMWALQNSKNHNLERFFKKGYRAKILQIIQENDILFK